MEKAMFLASVFITATFSCLVVENEGVLLKIGCGVSAFMVICFLKVLFDKQESESYFRQMQVAEKLKKDFWGRNGGENSLSLILSDELVINGRTNPKSAQQFVIAMEGVIRIIKDDLEIKYPGREFSRKQIMVLQYKEMDGKSYKAFKWFLIWLADRKPLRVPAKVSRK